MSSYRDPTLRGDVYPSEEEIDPTGIGLDQGGASFPYRTVPVPGPTPEPEPDPVPHPGPPPRTAGGMAYPIVTRHLDGRLDTVLRDLGRTH